MRMNPRMTFGEIDSVAMGSMTVHKGSSWTCWVRALRGLRTMTKIAATTWTEKLEEERLFVFRRVLEFAYNIPRLPSFFSFVLSDEVGRAGVVPTSRLIFIHGSE